MDNAVPSSQQRPTQQPAAQPTPPQVSLDDKPIMAQPQVGTPNKEFAPLVSGSPSEQGAQPEDADGERVARQETLIGTKVAPQKEVELPKELQEAGVEQGVDIEEEIPIVVQKAGMRNTDADSAVPAASQITIKLPINYAHATQLDKRSKIKESIKWLARAIKRQWERMSFFEKHKGDKLEEV